MKLSTKHFLRSKKGTSTVAGVVGGAALLASVAAYKIKLKRLEKEFREAKTKKEKITVQLKIVNLRERAVRKIAIATVGAATVAAGMKHGSVLAKKKILKFKRFNNNVNNHIDTLEASAVTKSMLIGFKTKEQNIKELLNIVEKNAKDTRALATAKALMRPFIKNIISKF